MDSSFSVILNTKIVANDLDQTIKNKSKEELCDLAKRVVNLLVFSKKIETFYKNSTKNRNNEQKLIFIQTLNECLFEDVTISDNDKKNVAKSIINLL